MTENQRLRELLQEAGNLLGIMRQADAFAPHAYAAGDDDASIVDLARHIHARIDAVLAAPAGGTEHNWVQRGVVACWTCGVVKREDGKNKPCRGKVNVTLRESQMSCDEARVEIEQLTQERDEARAEIEHWKGAAKEHAENHAAAVEAFHDATRLRSEIQQARIAAEIERDEARAEVERLKEALEDAAGDMHQRIRAGYDKTIADCWRAKVAEVEKQRDDAYRRGAEAMREAAANAIPSHYSGDFIRALPIPEDKP